MIITEQERRLNVTSRILAAVSSFGGQQIIAGEPMNAMVERLADVADELAYLGLLPPPQDPPFITVVAEGQPVT